MTSTAVSLPEGACRSYRRGGILRCVDGSLWVTFEGQSNDYVIDAGESIRLPRGLSVVQALSSSRIEVCEKAAHSERP